MAARRRFSRRGCVAACSRRERIRKRSLQENEETRGGFVESCEGVGKFSIDSYLKRKLCIEKCEERQKTM